MLLFVPGCPGSGPSGNMARNSALHTELRRFSAWFRYHAYAGGLKFSVITLCTETARPFME